ncbi:MAG: TetR/AcrR family transcriptional regulator [Alistipes sp.]|nr:TetR/AcrR family transcriptional regulator [Alistipes sp.]
MGHDKTRTRVIEITSDIITRNGIRAARVDEIARAAGISKRTLYEMFADKTTLIYRCLEQLSARRREVISREIVSADMDSLHRIFRFVDEYISSLYVLDRWFLADLKHRVEFVDNYESDFVWWKGNLVDLLGSGIDEGYLLPDTDVNLIAESVLSHSYELRVADHDKEAQTALMRALLRGIATMRGIAEIDAMR